MATRNKNKNAEPTIHERLDEAKRKLGMNDLKVAGLAEHLLGKPFLADLTEQEYHSVVECMEGAVGRLNAERAHKKAEKDTKQQKGK